MDNLELLSEYTSFLNEKKAEGKKIIAFMSHDNIPEELIDAAGFIPLRMLFAGNDEIRDSSHDFLPPSTCAFAQTCIGLFSIKPNQYRFLELIDYFIVSNHCVTDICASEIISNYFNIPRLNFYVSYTKNEKSLEYFKLELNDLKEQLERIKGNEIKNNEILESVNKYNRFKKILSKLNELNISGSEKLRIMQKAMLFGPHVIPELEEFIEKNQLNLIQNSNNKKSILFTGCSIFINDFLIDLIEESGGNIVFFDTWVGFSYYSQIFNKEKLHVLKDPINLFTHRFKNNIYGDHTVPNFLENKISLIEKFYNDYKLKTGKNIGVINHIIKFCDHMSIMSSHLKDRLQNKGIQVLNLERDYSKANQGQISTRIEAFLEMM